MDLFTDAETAIVKESLLNSPTKINVGIKDLLMLAEMARQDEANKVEKFLVSLHAACRKNL